MLRAPQHLSADLAQALNGLQAGTGLCATCFNITEAGQGACAICASPERDASQVCVVEDALDVLALERTAGYRGKYHVLQGALSPIEGVGPEDLRIRELLQRLGDGQVREVILATNPSMEGDATAMYLQQQLRPQIAAGLRVTRLARGLPMGGDLEYADQSTLLRALAGRQELE